MTIPANQVQIVNEVMIELGRLPVISTTDDDWAQLIASRIDYDIKYIIGMHSWAWATKFIADSAVVLVPPNPDYTYGFQLPADFINFNRQRNNLDYLVQGQVICSNSASIQYFYIANPIQDNGVTDYTVLPNYFVRLVVYYTANRVSLPLTENTDIKRANAQDFLKEMTVAKWQDAMLNPVRGAPYNQYDRGGMESFP